MRIPYAVPGSTVDIHTGEWRALMPVVNPAKCVKCGICQNFCPEGIMGTVTEVPDIDYDYCKGCSMCQVECPVKAITMVEDTKDF